MPTSRSSPDPARQSAESSSGPAPAAQRAVSRGWLLVLAALLAGTAGFVATWLASGPLPSETDEPIDFGLVSPAQPGASTASSEAETDVSAGLPDGLTGRVDEEPASVDALRAEATRVADALVDNFPQLADALEVSARLHAKLGDSDEASANWQRCLEIDPNYAYAYHGLGGLAAQRGKHEEAVKLFRRALICQPTLLMTQLELGDALINNGRLDEAIELLERNVKLDPQAYRGYVLMGMAYFQQQDYEQAKASYEAALRLAPQHASALFGLANVYRRLGQDEEAERYQQAYRQSRDSETEQRVADRQTYDDQQVLSAALADIYIDAGQVYWTLQQFPNAEHLRAAHWRSTTRTFGPTRHWPPSMCVRASCRAPSTCSTACWTWIPPISAPGWNWPGSMPRPINRKRPSHS